MKTFTIDNTNRHKMIIDWGDGNITQSSSDEITHTYAAAGDYKVRLLSDGQDFDILDLSTENISFTKAVFDGTNIKRNPIIYNKTNELTFGPNTRTIGRSAFANSATFKILNIPDTVQSIGDNAFKTTVTPDSIYVGSGVTDMGIEVFNGLGGLNCNITLACTMDIFNKNLGLTSCNSITFKNMRRLETGIFGLRGANPVQIKTHITFGEGVENIGAGLCYDGANPSVDITNPGGVYTINIGDSVKAIESDTGLIYVTDTEPSVVNLNLGKNLERIEGNAFGLISTSGGIIPLAINWRYCEKLDYIGDGAFNGISSTDKYLITTNNYPIPNSVTHIGYSAFAETNYPTIGFTIPENIVYVGDNAFTGWDLLQNVELTFPYSCIYLGKGAFPAASPLTVTGYFKDINGVTTGYTALQYPNAYTDSGWNV